MYIWSYTIRQIGLGTSFTTIVFFFPFTMLHNVTTGADKGLYKLKTNTMVYVQESNVSLAQSKSPNRLYIKKYAYTSVCIYACIQTHEYIATCSAKVATKIITM